MKEQTEDIRLSLPAVDKYLAVIKKTRLFSGIGEEELKEMLSCLGARMKKYPRGSFLIHAGDAAQDIGILLSGRAQIVRVDILGNRMILAGLDESDLFGEAFACLSVEEVPISVEAVEDCEVLWLNMRRVVEVCPSACRFHSHLIENMLQVLAGKNLELNEKVRLLSLKTTREKLLQYLCSCAEAAGKKRFEIPYNRSELADFLGVDRSAMSRELSRMRKEKLLDFERNYFELFI